ncbi:MAG: hypothetical protein IKB09_08650 [Oscillospiraceae bacterium]|nr:hypothetical protein [Oscillospiraceae bacterium]
MKKMISMVLRCVIFAAAVICTSAVLQYAHSEGKICALCVLSELDVQEALEPGTEWIAGKVRQTAVQIGDISNVGDYLTGTLRRVLENPAEYIPDVKAFTDGIRKATAVLVENCGF